VYFSLPPISASSIQVICDDDTTEAPNNKSPFSHASSKIHQEKKMRQDARNHRDSQQPSYGVPVMHNPRTYGKTPTHFGDFSHPSPALGSYRNDHMHGRSEIFKQRIDFRKPPDFVLEEGELIDGHEGAGGAEGEGMVGEACDIQCEDDEFLCSESCFCIADHLRCGERISKKKLSNENWLL